MTSRRLLLLGLGQSIWELSFGKNQKDVCPNALPRRIVGNKFISMEVNFPNNIQEMIIARFGAKHLDFNLSVFKMHIYSQMLCPYKIVGNKFISMEVNFPNNIQEIIARFVSGGCNCRSLYSQKPGFWQKPGFLVPAKTVVSFIALY